MRVFIAGLIFATFSVIVYSQSLATLNPIMGDVERQQTIAAMQADYAKPAIIAAALDDFNADLDTFNIPAVTSPLGINGALFDAIEVSKSDAFNTAADQSALNRWQWAYDGLMLHMRKLLEVWR